MRKIVILEDDYALLDLYSDVLDDAGYSTYPATTIEAIELFFEENKADLIIADLRLGAVDPETTIQVLKTIRQEQNIPVLLISAKMTFYEDICREAGFTHRLQKPFLNSVLIQQAQDLIQDSDNSGS